jgi:hypothetical protein
MSFLLGLPILLIVVICIVAFCIHFLPAIVAGNRRARNFVWILVLNLFLGWTFIGWIVALVWAMTDEPRYVVGYVPRRPYDR